VPDDFQTALADSGAIRDGTGVAHFGDAGAELAAALTRCALVDRSDWTRLLGTGPDLPDLLQRLSTQDLRRLEPGGGAITVLTTPKGRIVERLFLTHLADVGIVLAGGAGTAQTVLDHLARYTFAEQTGLVDLGPASARFSLIGPTAAAALTEAGFDSPGPLAGSRFEASGEQLDVLGHDGLTSEGLTILVPVHVAGAVWRRLVAAVSAEGGRPAGQLAADSWRVLRGLPASGHELTEEHNPLEAGLGDSAVSFDKGCYVGQEVVARLNTYDKVSRRLVGLELESGAPLPETGTSLFDAGRSVGKLTTAVLPPDRNAPIALAYVKRDSSEGGRELRLGDAATGPSARVRPLPF
jgi:folate-binding protein YgfZ